MHWGIDRKEVAKVLRRALALVAAVVLASCGGTNTPSIPAPGGTVPHGMKTMAGASALPAAGASALPAGDSLACTDLLMSGSTDCSIVINVNVAPISDATTPSNLLPGLHPVDLQSAYALPSQNAGGTVAIVDAYDDPTAEQDLAVYRTAYGLPPCSSSSGCLRKLNQQGTAGAYPVPNAGWGEEISLDLDVVSAVCPNCKIALVEANSNSLDDLGAAVNTAAKLGAVAISNSYYAYEWPGELAYDTYYQHPGIAITASAGDAAQVLYPAASPYVTTVGGTSISASGGSWSETAWPYTGQGCSAYEPKPGWQGNNECQGKRSSSDMAAVADPQTGVSMYDSLAGGWLVAGGTSVGAPLIAAAYALSGNPKGPAYSYEHPGAFHDIAPAGYDWPTGLGTPNGVGGL